MSFTRETFYVGGKYVQDAAGKHTMQGQMYVERLTPASASDLKPYPIIFVHDGTRTGAVGRIQQGGEFFSLERGGTSTASARAPITYDPPVADPEVDLVKAARKSDAPGLMDATLQAESPPPRKLVNLTRMPVLVLTAQASYHAQYDWYSVEYLRQAGVQTEHIKLEDLGILGNGHMMFMEKNSDDVAAVIKEWITKTLS